MSTCVLSVCHSLLFKFSLDIRCSITCYLHLSFQAKGNPVHAPDKTERRKHTTASAYAHESCSLKQYSLRYILGHSVYALYTGVITRLTEYITATRNKRLIVFRPPPHFHLAILVVFQKEKVWNLEENKTKILKSL